MPSESFSTMQRRNALHALLLFTIPAAALFLLVNAYHNLVLLPTLNAVLTGTSIALFIASRHGAALIPIATIYLVILAGVIVALITRPDIHPNGYIFMTCIPVLSYILLGHRGGLWLTSGFLAAATIAYSVGADRLPEHLEPMRLINTITATLGLFLVCHFWTRGQATARERLLRLSETDSLTGLDNRAAFDRAFERERARHERTGTPVSVVVVDLDEFKLVNDNYGHAMGDRVLIEFAAMLRARLRPADGAFRIGGEEFALLLPDTHAAGAMTAAEDLRSMLATTPIRKRNIELCVTLSAGIAELGPDGASWTRLYQRADQRLYACKAAGRNRVSAGSTPNGSSGSTDNGFRSDPA